ncbi:hypothetical protein SDC9_203983 [bioreactor metagenome]|uniref:Uncharacterized protein n=1 Tax=bioreactor metagenome TaxID=1076179 RepID=A0A645IYQ6_9ZZZZ
MAHRCQRINVGPRPLLHARHLGVLLDRCITRLQDHGQGLRHITNDPSRRTKIEQNRTVVTQQHDVVRCNITVETVLAVDQLQRIDHRRQHLADPAFVRQSATRPQHISQGTSVIIGHGHVGRTVGFPETIDLDQRGMIELSQQSRLVDEAAATNLESFAMAFRAHRDSRVTCTRRQ